VIPNHPELALFEPRKREGEPSCEIRPDDPNIKFLVELLTGKGWMTAKEIIAAIEEKTQRQVPDRLVRALASASQGRIAGGQKGYKLVQDMTHEEYNHWRHWMSSQADEMRRRVIEADKLFYRKKPIEAGV